MTGYRFAMIIVMPWFCKHAYVSASLSDNLICRKLIIVGQDMR